MISVRKFFAANAQTVAEEIIVTSRLMIEASRRVIAPAAVVCLSGSRRNCVAYSSMQSAERGGRSPGDVERVDVFPFGSVWIAAVARER